MSSEYGIADEAFIEVSVPASELCALMSWLSVFEVHDALGITFHFGPRRQMVLSAMDTSHISMFEAFIPFVKESPLLVKDISLRILAEVDSLMSKATLTCRSADFVLKFNACVGSGAGEPIQFLVPVKNWDTTPLTMFHVGGAGDEQFAVELSNTLPLQVPTVNAENAMYIGVTREVFTNALQEIGAIDTKTEPRRLRITAEPHNHCINLALSKSEQDAEGNDCSVCASARWHVPGSKRSMVCGVSDEFFVDIHPPRLVALDTHFPGGSVLLRLQPEYVTMFAYPLSDMAPDELADAGLYVPEGGGGWAEDDVPLPFACLCLFVAPMIIT